jgi:predicted regulator of Ras-like GTPase activity (Roadblock/LC7/MglB family)
MLTLFKKLFGKSGAKNPAPLAPSASAPSPQQMQFESAIQMAKVEVAKLSLKAIVAKFPEEIRALLNSAPDDKTTVALPIQTIVKQLHAGVVRMSLASLHRQAPQGLFKPLPAGDKRMVEVPLAEVFKHVKPTVLKRRGDQRQLGPVDEDLEEPVFNSRVQAKPAEQTPAPAPATVEEEAIVAEPAPTAMRVVAPPTGLNLAAKKTEAKPAAEKAVAAPAKCEAPSAGEPTLTLPLAKFSEGWPDEVRRALGELDAATNVAVPHSHIAPGLARGKISCTWKQVRAWLTPAAPDDIAIDPETTLLLPLKVIAPAFLATKKPAATPRKSVTLDETIPALFSGGKAPTEPPPVLAEAKKEAAEAPAATDVETPAPAEERVIEIEIDEPVAEEKEAEPAAAEKAPEPEAEVAPVAPPVEAAPAQTIGDALGEPGKTDWTPASLVKAVVKLPGVAGAIIALEEGFQVANALPDGVSAETVSAFLPQIFTRLNQYAGEMKLGDVDDLLFTTRGAHCMIYRLGTLYLAVLGKPGETLPWNALRLVAAELSRQVTK